MGNSARDGRKRRPLATKGKSKKLPDLITLACKLSPHGPPSAGYLWRCSEGSTPSDSIYLARSIFLKTPECPIRSRWYTVGKCSAYRYLHNCFSLAKATIVPVFDLAHWPGDDVAQEEEGRDAYMGETKEEVAKGRRLYFIGRLRPRSCAVYPRLFLAGNSLGTSILRPAILLGN